MKQFSKSLFIGVSLFSLSACFDTSIPGGINKLDPLGNNGPTNPGGSIDGGGGDESEDKKPVTVGVKNAEQILVSMASATGIDPFLTATITTANQTSLTPVAAAGQATAVLSIYDTFLQDYKGILPASNSIGAFNANAQIAVVKLSFAFCDALAGLSNETNVPANVTAARTLIFGQNFFTAPQLQALNLKQSVVLPLLNRFWGTSEGVVSSETRAMAETELTDLATRVASSQAIAATQNQSQKVRLVVKAVCTAALSASPTIVF